MGESRIRDLIGKFVAHGYKVAIYLYLVKTIICAPFAISYERRRDIYHEKIRLSKSMDRSSVDSEELDRLRQWTFEPYKVLVSVGSHYRDCGIDIVIMVCLVFFLVPFIYHSTNWLYRRELAAETGVLSFMCDYQLEMRRLNKRIDMSICRAELSIEIHMTILAANEKINGFSYSDSIDCSSAQLISQVEFIIKHLNKNDDAINSPETLKKLIDAFLIKRLEIQRSISSLSSDLDYLNQLKSTRKKLLIWPANRNSEWKKTMLKKWTGMTIFAYVIYWSWGFTTSNLVLNLIHERALINSSVDGYPREFSLLEHLDIICFRFFGYMSLDWYSEPAAYLYTSFQDQKKYLTSICEKMRKLSAEFKASAETSREKICDNINHLDLKLLESYVSFQIFTGEINAMFKRAEHSVVFLYSSLLVTIIILVAMSLASPKMFVLRIFAVGVTATLNFCIVPYAMLNQKCETISKLAYSIIAQAEKINSRSTGQEAGESCRISAHSLNLWRKFIADSSLYSENFSCELLGIASLNYGTIFRLNFAIISSIGVLLTHY